MHQILVWQLSSKIRLIFSSAVSDLGSITCCDRLTLSVSDETKSATLTTQLAGCDVEKLQKLLQSLVVKEQQSINFLKIMTISSDIFGQFLITLQGDQGDLCYQIVDVLMIQGWVRQLELLHVLMEENDLEKKSRGKGCC